MPKTRQLLAAAAALLLLIVVTTGCPKPPADSTDAMLAPGDAPGHDTAPASGTDAVATIQAKGSDTLLQVAQALAEAYADKDLNIDVAVTGGGSGTGFQALIEGTTDIANASRKIKDKELAQAKDAGVEPVENTIGYDGIAVIVNKAGPLVEATIQQLSDIYTGQATDWSALGGEGEIVLFSRDSTSGTFEYFKEHVVMRGDKQSGLDYAAAINMLPSNSAIRDQVAQTPNGIGYIGLGYVDDSVKTLAILGEDGQAVAPSVDTVKDGSYVISRPLFMYTAQDPDEPVKAFMEWVLGEDGQAIVADEGFVPID